MAKRKDYSNVPKTTEVQKNQLDNSENFLIVNVEDKWRIGIANRWVTRQAFSSPEEAQKYIDQKPWDMIMNAAAIMAEFMYKEMTGNNNL